MQVNTEQPKEAAKPGVLSLAIKEKAALYASPIKLVGLEMIPAVPA